MRDRCAALVGALLFAVGLSALGATFRAEIEGNKVVVYSSSTKDEACYSTVTFSYKKGDGREVRKFVCNTFARKGKDFRFCERGDESYVDLRIEEQATGTCG
ncbi:MAG TPA: hypothetical protein VMH32_02490 [Burkholderiales bacterium]|nr:hypothetical protein [Burkholderiales bacterium]